MTARQHDLASLLEGDVADIQAVRPGNLGTVENDDLIVSRQIDVELDGVHPCIQRDLHRSHRIFKRTFKAAAAVADHFGLRHCPDGQQHQQKRTNAFHFLKH